MIMNYAQFVLNESMSTHVKWKDDLNSKISDLEKKLENYKDYSPSEVKNFEKELAKLKKELASPNGSEQH